MARLIMLSCMTLVQSIHLSQTHQAPQMPTRPPTDKGQEQVRQSTLTPITLCNHLPLFPKGACPLI